MKDMAQNKLSDGTAHKLPTDLKKALLSQKLAVKQWESLTPLARNEWICWNTAPKKLETKKNHLERTVKELQEGKRRPCCWAGCIHRTDKQIAAASYSKNR